MNIKFNAQVDAFVPGNFVSWRIIPITGQKTPAIEDDYTLTGEDVVIRAVDLAVHQSSPYSMPTVHGEPRLNDAVFEIEKTARKQFRVVRYVGTLKVEHKIEPAANVKVLGASVITEEQTKQAQKLVPGASRFSDLDY
jgi:hypothetical protein